MASILELFCIGSETDSDQCKILIPYDMMKMSRMDHQEEFPLGADFNPACPSCGKRHLIWSIRASDGAPVATCSACDDSLIGSPDDRALIEFAMEQIHEEIL